MPSLEDRADLWERACQNPKGELVEPQGSVSVFIPRPNVCLTIAKGHLSLALARVFVASITPEFTEDRRFAYFHDWEEMTAYESAARRILTNWALANREYARSSDYLVSSRIVAMGVSVANVALSSLGLTLTAHTSRLDFEQALRRALTE